jgi:galactitol-specific phosphotransferase system IIB component
VPTFAWLFRQLSHSVGVGTSRTLEDRIIEICDENRIKTAYYDQQRYDSFDSSDNENEGVRSLVEIQMVMVMVMM